MNLRSLLNCSVKFGVVIYRFQLRQAIERRQKIVVPEKYSHRSWLLEKELSEEEDSEFPTVDPLCKSKYVWNELTVQTPSEGRLFILHITFGCKKKTCIWVGFKKGENSRKSSLRQDVLMDEITQSFDKTMDEPVNSSLQRLRLHDHDCIFNN